MRTVIAVDLNTMRELADEEVRVCSEKIDWCEAAYREEAISRGRFFVGNISVTYTRAPATASSSRPRTGTASSRSPRRTPSATTAP